MEGVKRNDDRTGLQELFDGFLLSLQSEGRAGGTIGYYRNLIHPFLGYPQNKGWSNNLGSLEAHGLREFLSWVGSRTYESSIGNGTKQVRKANRATALPYYRALRRLFNWAIEVGYLESIPF